MFGIRRQNVKVRNGIIGTLVLLYVLSIVTCTVSFFTPYWLYDVGNNSNDPLCHRVGLISGTCRFPYRTDLQRQSEDYYMRGTFYCVLTAMLLLYTNAAMTIAGYLFDLFDNMTYMAFLSVHYGLLYPIGAIVLLASSITLEVHYGSKVGASTVLSTVSGALMLLFYAGLRLYDFQHTNGINREKRE